MGQVWTNEDLYWKNMETNNHIILSNLLNPTLVILH